MLPRPQNTALAVGGGAVWVKSGLEPQNPKAGLGAENWPRLKHLDPTPQFV